MGLYKDMNTGDVGTYPDDFAQFFGTLVPITEEEPCSDCFIDNDNDNEKRGKHSG